ncbi:MAG: DRTGG domain-containing protein, partial [Candidatus Omnitrophota bacterium]
NILGVLPYVETLSTPTVRLIKDELRLKLLCGEAGLDNNVKKILIGAMEPHNALNYIVEGSLIITPGDREDIILASVSSHTLREREFAHIAGLVLTGNLRPQKTIFGLLKRANIPVLLSPDDTYMAASKIHDLIVKVQPQDKEKIFTIVDLVERYIDIDKILNSL